MRSFRPHTIALALIAIFAVAPSAAEMYKWVDERGVTTYSDKKPDDPKSSDKVKTVGGNLSVYSPDKSLLHAVEVARARANQPPPPEPPRFYAAPVMEAPFAQNDPCQYTDCGGYYYPAAAYPYRRRAPFVVQTILPPGAQPGLINSPGIIPGNSATTQFNTPTRTAKSAVREPARPRVQPLDSRFR